MNIVQSKPGFRLPSVALLCAVLLAGCGEDSSLTESEYMIRAKEFQAKGEVQSSSIELKNVLQINPKHMEARMLLGLNYVELGDGISAAKELRLAGDLGAAEQVLVLPRAKAYFLQREWETLLQEAPVASAMSADVRAELHAMRGRALLERQNLAAATTEYEEALKAKEDSVPAMLGQAFLALAQRKLDEARTWSDKALKKAPDSGEAWGMAGDIERAMGEREKAEAAYSKAVDLRLNNGQNRMDRAMLRIDLGRYEEAESDLVVLARLAPRHPGVAYARGMIHFRNQRFAEAQTAFENALRFGAKNPQLKFFLGATHLAQGNLEQAEDNLRQFATRFPQSSAAAKLLARTRLLVKDHAGAESALKPLVQSEANDIAAITLMGQVYFSQGALDEGVAQLEKAVDLQPEVADSHFLLGMGLLGRGSTDQGMSELQTALNLDPEMRRAELAMISTRLKAGDFDGALNAIGELKGEGADALASEYLRGAALTGKGDYEGARTAFGKMLENDPAQVSPRMGLAMLEIRSGDLDAAGAQYKKILENSPNETGAMLGLARLATQSGRADEALRWMEKAWAASPDSMPLGRQLVQAYLSRKDTTSATTVVQGMKTTDSAHPDTLRASGVTNLSIGQTDAAQQDFLRLTKLESENASSWHFLAVAQLQSKDSVSAIRSLDQALRIDAGYLPSLLAVAKIKQKQNLPDDALTVARQISTLYPGRSIGYKLEGDLLLQAEDYQNAAQAYSMAWSKDREPNVLIALGRAQQLSGNEGAAQATRAQWREVMGEVAGQAKADSNEALQAQLMLVQSYLEENRHDEALALASELLERRPGEAGSHNLKGIVLLIKGDTQAAVAELNEALRIEPGYPPAIHALARQALEVGDVEQAESLYMQALKRNPDHLRSQMALMQIEAGRNNIEAARDWALRIVESHPEAAAPKLLLARHYLSVAQPAKVVELIGDVNSADPDSLALLELRGEAFLALGQARSALRAFKKILSAEPEAAQAQFLLAKAYFLDGDSSNGDQALNEALRIDPTHLPANIAKVRLLANSGKLDAAQELIGRLAEALPNNAEVSAQRGWLALKLGNLEEAEQFLHQAVDRFSVPNRQVVSQLAAVKWKMGKKQATFDLLENWIQSDAQDNFMRMTVANYYLLEGRSEDARSAYEKVLESAPNTLIALHNLAGIWQQTDPERAQLFSERAVALDPENPVVLDRLATILLAGPNTERALSLLQRAADQAPNRTSIHYHLAQALIKTGDDAAALEVLNKLLAGENTPDERDNAKALQQKLRAQ